MSRLRVGSLWGRYGQQDVGRTSPPWGSTWSSFSPHASRGTVSSPHRSTTTCYEELEEERGRARDISRKCYQVGEDHLTQEDPGDHGSVLRHGQCHLSTQAGAASGQVG
jgi:hypothetical protein